MPAPDETHSRRIIKAITEGTIVPLLGAGVNLSGRPADIEWQKGCEYLPDGGELATYLARYFDYPGGPGGTRDLARVSQYGDVKEGSGPLYRQLQEIFCAEYRPTPVHRFLASVPRLLGEHGHRRRYQLIVSTNYDDALERAFEDEEEAYDLVIYVAEGELRGKFLHTKPGEEPVPILLPNQYPDFPIDERGELQRTVILKIHGAVDRSIPPVRPSYVITEDHYIEYMSRSELANLVPKDLLAKMMESHFLFLGYSLRDWNLRVLLHRIWGQQKLSYRSWAVQLDPEDLDEEFWEKRGVDILDMPLDAYVGALQSSFEASEASLQG